MSNHPVNHAPIVRDAAPGTGVGLPASQMNTSVVAIEQQRAIAEAEGQLTLAKKFPRNFSQAMEEILNSCSYIEFAEEAFYALPRGGQTVRGPSIRLAEEIARCYGNFQYGHRELARNDGESVVEVYAWDMERNNRSSRQITIPHIMDTRQGGKKLVGQKEIADYIANIASKQMRSRILALLPKPLVAAAIKRCEATLAGTGDQTIQQRLEKMQGMFIKYGVTVAMLETYLGHSLDKTTTDEITDLIAVYSAIKDGAGAKEFFTVSSEAADDESTKNVNEIIKRNNANVNTKPTGETLVKPETQTETKPQADAEAGKAADPKAAAADKSTKANTRATGGKGNKPAKPAQQPETKPEDNTGIATAGAAGEIQSGTVETQQPTPEPQQPDPQPEPPIPEDDGQQQNDLTPPPMDIPPPASEEDYF